MIGKTVTESERILAAFLALRGTVERCIKSVEDGPEVDFTAWMKLTEMHRAIAQAVKALTVYIKLMTTLPADDVRAGIESP
jgi:hypothetical protein